jgi:carboxylesterase type B
MKYINNISLTTGNFGMKDQVVALQWIKNNIGSFGGDPESITLFGESAGASSVGLHMMSDLSQDLFQRAIFQSSSPDSHWSVMTDAEARERSAAFLKNVQCDAVADTDDMLACLRNLTADTILNNEWVVGNFMVFPWVPSVDGDFLKDTPHNLLYQGKYAKKDTLLGVNKEEGTFWILYVLPGMYKDQESLQNYTMFKAGVDTMDWDLATEMRDIIKTMYSPSNISDTEANRDNMEHVCGDRTFTCPTIELARLLGESSTKTYLYYLTHRASNEVWHPWMGVIHGADIQVRNWLFRISLQLRFGFV